MTAYRGEKQWAPCYHGDDAEQQTTEYVRSVLLKDRDPERPEFRIDKPTGIEDLLWAFGLGWYCGEWAKDITDIKWGFYADQWVGVSAEIHKRDGSVTNLWTEADTFTMGIAKTMERLKDGGVWGKPSVEDDDDDEEENAPEVAGG